jgi:hypothetical protein
MSARPARQRRPAGSAAAAVVLLALASVSACPTQSLANGDPASDVLLAQDVFYPYNPKVSPTVEAALESTLRAAARSDRLHLKVAIIGAPEELGIVPRLFGHPQSYAQFLDSEISFNQPQALLVVMPAGFGVMPATLTSAVAGVPINTQQRSDGLTRSAILAVVALARYEGHPIPIPSISPSKATSSPPALLVFGLPALLLALAGLVLMRRGRSRKGTHLSDTRDG